MAGETREVDRAPLYRQLALAVIETAINDLRLWCRRRPEWVRLYEARQCGPAAKRRRQRKCDLAVELQVARDAFDFLFSDAPDPNPRRKKLTFRELVEQFDLRVEDSRATLMKQFDQTSIDVLFEHDDLLDDLPSPMAH